MATLSVLYIARNEDLLLPRSMSSVEPIADEIIVVDTGSADSTGRTARQFRKTKVVTHAWVHDFSKARNFGLAQCTKDWVLYLDADEFLDDRSARLIRSSMDAPGNVQGFALHVVDHELDWNERDAGRASFFPSPQVRLFRRLPGIAFEGRVMESVRPSVEKAGAVDVLNARVHHFLWRGKGPEYAGLKVDYYRKLGATLPDFATAASRSEAAQVPDCPARAATEVAVVVPAHNSLVHTKQCVQSIIRNTTTPVELVLVDNGSTDGTGTFMREVCAREPVSFRRNEGVAKAKNAGATAAMRNPALKYLCFLDNDTIVAPGWIETMSLMLDQNPQLGAVGPLTSNGPSIQSVSGQYDALDVESVSARLPERSPELVKAEAIGGFCMLVRTEALKKVGLFDESFGLFGHDDADMCRRLRLAGYELGVANRAYVVHRGAATLKANPAVNWHSTMITAAARYKAKWKTSESTWPLQSAGGAPALMAARAMPPAPRVSIVIIAHNRLDMTRTCLEAIRRHTRNYELIFVDNASTDGTDAYVRSFGGAKVMTNVQNVGVPKARNQGIRATTTPYVVLMDNDVEVRTGWLEEMMAEMAGADMVGLEGWQINQDFCASYKCCSDTDRVDYLGGACTLSKRKVYETVGLLDEGFSPAYYEDLEWCIRAKASGFRLKWKPTQKMVHREHSTLIHGQRDFNYQDTLAKSHDYFARKMRGQITVQHEMLPPVDKKLRIMYLGMYYDYGVKERGTSFEQDNFWPALSQYTKTGEIMHFDFVEMGKQHGVPRMTDMLFDAAREFAPDAMFGIFFDEHHDPRREIFRKIARELPGTKSVGWFCDSHWRYDSFDRPWSNYLDFCVTTSESAYHQKYIRDGLGGKAIKSQWAAAPSYRRADVPLDIDVSFVGQPHGDRRSIVARLQRAGIPLRVYGHGWGMPSEGVVPRRLSFDDMTGMFSRSKINLNLSNSSGGGHKQIKGRNFEVPACGGFLLTEDVENLADYYVIGQEVVTYGSFDDMVDKIRYYLAHETERAAIAEAGMRRTLAEHAYSNRFDKIFSRMGLL